MTPTFNPPVAPSPGSTDTPDVKVLEADFGDGYAQATPAGINNIKRVLSLKWDLLERADKDEIEAFFQARKGAEPFTYTVPGEALAWSYTCKEWSSTALGANLFSLTATLRRSFAA